jgi:hypothetical protein
MASPPSDEYLNSQFRDLFPTSSLATKSYSNSLLLSDTTAQDDQRSPSPLPNHFTIKQADRKIPPYRQSVPRPWAVAIILGQLVILAIAYSFFVAVYYFGPVSLPDSMAAKATKFPRIVTLIATLVATALSLVSALYVHFMADMIICPNIP